eukprot:4178106-Alexandrium_andersonii.AAC.1
MLQSTLVRSGLSSIWVPRTCARATAASPEAMHAPCNKWQPRPDGSRRCQGRPRRRSSRPPSGRPSGAKAAK